MLSDEQRRQIYDVYGKQGLLAGFEVGEGVKNKEDLKREWEEFRKKQEQQQQEALANHKGTYMCKMDGRNVVSGLARTADRLAYRWACPPAPGRV